MKLKILLVEDNQDDALLILRTIRRVGYEIIHQQVATAAEMEIALEQPWDVILSDYSLPQFGGGAALDLCKRKGVDIPFIIVSGAIGEGTAVEMMLAGASDYIMKDNLTRLVPAIRREMAEAEVRRERRQAELVQAAVYRISQAANTAATLPDLYQAIHNSLCEIMPAEHFYIAIFNPQKDLFEYPYAVDPNHQKNEPHEPEFSLEGTILQTGQSLLADENTLADLIAQGKIAPFQPLPRQWLGVPLKGNQDQILGVMVVQTYQEGVQFDGNDLAVLDFISNQVALVVQRRLAEASLRESEKKFSMFMTYLPVQAFIKDSQDQIVFANQYFRETFPDVNFDGNGNGNGHNASKRRVAQDSLPLLQNDPATLAGELVQKAWEIAQPDGIHHFESMQFLIPQEDQPPLLGGIAWDITKLKHAEAQALKSATELALAYDATLEGWSRALEMRERETAGHSQRVVDLTLALACELDFPEWTFPHLRRGALLHDIGKMGIPDRILLKDGPLTEDEWLVMRQHPIYAYQLLSRIPYLQPALEIPLYHHEKWAGGGYPKGLIGENIPMGARVFSLVDVWDALTTDRPYRLAWSEDKTLDHLQEQSGLHFDPSVVQAFFDYRKNSSRRTMVF